VHKHDPPTGTSARQYTDTHAIVTNVLTIVGPLLSVGAILGTYYFSVVTGSMFANFYADTDGIQGRYVSMWQDIATAFAGRPEVLGYAPRSHRERERQRVCVGMGV
jgi:hypothetical protein